MKIHEYNQMMAYLTRPATPTKTPDTRQQAASGGRIELANGSPDPMMLMEDEIKFNYKKKRLKELEAGKDPSKIQSYEDYIKTQTEVDLNPGKKKLDKTIADAKKLLKNNVPKLKAALLPGLEQIAEGIKKIPDDFKKKRYFTLGLKALGPLGTYLAVDDTYDALKAGKPVAEALERGLIGTNIIGATKDVFALSPEGKEARSVVKQAEIRDQIDQDESMLDTDFDQPTVKSDFNLEEAIAKYKSEQDNVAEDRTAQEGQTAANRKTGFKNLKDRVFGISLDDITKEYYNQGGRVGYADGPKDPKRRTVIKGLTALAALPVIGKYFKLAPKAGKIATVAMEKVSGMPNWFQPFVNKVLKKGMDVTDEAATAEREIVKRIDIEDATVDVHYNTATNDVRVEIAGGNKNALDQPFEMQYKAPEVIEETGKKTKGEFKAVESKPEAVQTGPDDYDFEAGENVTDVLDDLLSETDYLEGFATGKIRTANEIKKAKNRAFHRKNMKEDPAQYILEEDMGNFSSPDRKNYETITSLNEIEDLLTITKNKK